jgi:hypothetical protein
MNEEDATIAASAPACPVFYANVAFVMGTPEEVYLQFGLRNLADPKQSSPAAMVITSFPHAKRFLKALQSLIDHHERLFGRIPEDMAECLTPEGRAEIEAEAGP